MAGYENIKDKGFDHRTTEELRVITANGGKASGKTRRRKADFRKTLNMLLTAEVDTEMSAALKALGVDSTLESAMLMAMIKAALEGDVKAANFVAQYSGQSDKSAADEEEQRIRTDRAKRARDQEVGEVDGAEENIQAFIKAMHPTQEDLDNMFADDENEEVDIDAEESEETDNI